MSAQHERQLRLALQMAEVEVLRLARAVVQQGEGEGEGVQAALWERLRPVSHAVLEVRGEGRRAQRRVQSVAQLVAWADGRGLAA